MGHHDREFARLIEDEVWEAAPRRLLPILILLLVMLSLAACGIVKPDPEYVFGPRSVFDKQERTSGGV
jgi:hypothetical protein